MKTNGCGACSGFWKWLKPPQKNFFVKECNQHDEAYSIGGSANDRKQADKRLFFDMVYKSVDHYRDRKATSMWWFVTLAFCYYLAVRACGKKSFKHKINNNQYEKDYRSILANYRELQCHEAKTQD